MLTFVAIVHVIIALGLVLFVLLQDPKGGAAGVFGGGGGGSNSLFGSTGAGNFLTSTTKWLAILFAVTCITLTYLTSHNTSSIMDDMATPTVPVDGTTQPAPIDSPAIPAQKAQEDAPPVENNGAGAVDTAPAATTESEAK